MAQHTHGPWEVRKVEQRYVATGHTERQFVIERRYPNNLADEIALVVRHVKPESQQEADARLIAKSPDLLALAEGMVMYPDVKNHIAAKFPGLIKQAEALLAEIKGGAAWS